MSGQKFLQEIGIDLYWMMRKQKTPHERGFTHHDIKRLRKSMSSVADKRTYVRLQCVLWVAEGMAPERASQLSGLCVKSVYNHVHCFLREHNPEALSDSIRSGRPLTAISLTDKRIRSALRQNPFELGYSNTVWTVSCLADYLNKKYNCFISDRTLRRRMKEIGLRFKRPRYVYAEKDPNRAQKKGLLCES